jgi:hypothetical protein
MASRSNAVMPSIWTGGAMKLVLLTMMILVAPSAFAQTHAPTLEVCRADAALWYNDDMSAEYDKAEAIWISDHVPNRTPTAKLPLKEVIARQNEMYDCARVDESTQNLYFDAGRFYHGVFADRAISFLARHNLMHQFQKEDVAGIR